MKPNNQKPEIVELDRLAKEGKLWCIETYYNRNQETCIMRYYNQTNDQVMRIREAVFRAGFIIPVKDKSGQPVKGSYRVIPPMDIVDMILTQQTGYFDGV